MWYWIFRAILAGILKLFFRLKADGLENLPQSNFIAVANHASLLDSLALGVALPKKIHCLVSRDIYNFRWLRWFILGSETMSVSHISKKAKSLLANNRCIGLFPEGRVSRNGKLQEFKRGAVMLALKTGRPIVPCAIIGTFKALPITAKFPKPAAIKVKIGKPIYVAKDFEDCIDDAGRQEITNRVRSAIEAMLE